MCIGLDYEYNYPPQPFVLFGLSKPKMVGKKKEELSKRGGTKKQYNFTAYANWQIA